MQFLLDFLPIVLFFAAYILTDDFFVALIVIMIAAPAALLVQWLLTRTFNKVSAGSTALVVVLGGGALLLDNKMIFIWKPTVFYWLLAIAFLASQFFGEKSFIQRLMESAGKTSDEPMELPRQKWSLLNLSWVIFFLLSGGLNIYVAYNYSEATWVKFKLFGLIGLTLVFVVAQSVWLARQLHRDVAE